MVMYIYIYVCVCVSCFYHMIWTWSLDILYTYHLKLCKIPVWDAATRLSRAPRPTLHLLRMEDLEAASLAAKAKTGPDIQQVLEANAERAAAIGLEPWRWPFWWPQPRIWLSRNIYIYIYILYLYIIIYIYIYIYIYIVFPMKSPTTESKKGRCLIFWGSKTSKTRDPGFVWKWANPKITWDYSHFLPFNGHFGVAKLIWIVWGEKLGSVLPMLYTRVTLEMYEHAIIWKAKREVSTWIVAMHMDFCSCGLYRWVSQCHWKLSF